MEEEKGWAGYSFYIPSLWLKDRAAHRRKKKASNGTFVEAPQTSHKPTQRFLLENGD